MVIDRDEIYEYPFHGTFYHTGIDMTKPYDEREEEEIIDLETACDIIEASAATKAEFIDATFTVFLPFDKEAGISIKRGLSFRGSIYGMDVNGQVLGVFPSQLSGCVVHIKDYNV